VMINQSGQVGDALAAAGPDGVLDRIWPDPEN
jgi:hypothetical protein